MNIDQIAMCSISTDSSQQALQIKVKCIVYQWIQLYKLAIQTSGIFIFKFSESISDQATIFKNNSGAWLMHAWRGRHL